MATSPGARGGASVLEIAKNNFTRFNADIKSVFSLPSFNDNFNIDTNVISNPELDNQLREIVKNF